jgi:uncharacterized protein (TIGR00369 family)
MDEIIKRFKERFEMLSPFQRFIGMRLEVKPDFTPIVRFDMRNELIGNFDYGILHGGIIASVMDVSAGIAAFLQLPLKYPDQTADQIMERVSKASTIDLRIDYLRPGFGETFTALGKIIRIGNKIAVSETDLFNEKEEHIAAARGTYIVG